MPQERDCFLMRACMAGGEGLSGRSKAEQVAAGYLKV